jgi:cation transport ATPase
MFDLFERKEAVADIISLLAGVLLFIAPWVMGYSTIAVPAWTAWVSGAVVVAMAYIALTSYANFAEWEEWIEAAVGIWVVAAPWALGFAANMTAMYVHVVLGIVVLVATFGEIGWLHMHRPTSV